MKRFLQYHGFSILYLILLSCIPLLWYGSGTIGVGHDMGWSLVPLDRFFDRLFSWTPSSFGYDQSLEIGALTIYLIPAFLSALHFSIVNVQKISYMFWFLAMGSSMYYFSQVIYKGKYARLVGVIAATFYILNHYTLQAWTVAEFSKFSAMTIFPIFLANIWLVIDKKLSLFKTAAITALFFFIFNGGGGSGIPLYGGMFIGLLLLFFYKWLVEKKSFIDLIKIYITFSIFAVLANLYWIIPLLGVIKGQYSPFAASGGPEATVAWTNVISKNTSFINLFRLQGFSSWYDSTNHPYAPIFLTNPFFILLSYVFPAIVFSAYFVCKDKNQKKILLFFSFLVLFSMVFVAGTHDPLGFLYAFLMTKVYGFAIFRTAFYKFGYALWFSYAFLFAVGCISLVQFFKKKIFISIGIGVIFLFLVIYNYPFFTSHFFDFDSPFKTMLQLPTYVIEAKDYLSTLPKTDRTLMIPPPSPTNGQSDVYDFGYFSRTPLPFELTQKSIVTNVEVNTLGQEKLTEALYNAILQNNENEAKNLITILGVNHILVRQDVLLNNTQYRIASPQDYTKNLISYQWIIPEKKMGAWQFYAVNLHATQLSVINPGAFATSNESVSSYFKDSSSLTTIPNAYVSSIIADCQNCNITNLNFFPPPEKVIFLPSSPLYFLETLQEMKNLKNSQVNPMAYMGYNLFYAERHALEMQQLAGTSEDKETLDQYQRYTILSSYISLVQHAYDTYQKLSALEKLQSAPEVISSLEKQRNILRTLQTTNFLADINTTYNHVYDLLNTFITNKDIQQKAQFTQNNLIYTVHIPQTGSYTVQIPNIDDSQKVHIDNQVISNKMSLITGDHTIDVSLSSQSAIPITQESLANNTSVSIPLTDLKESQLYKVSFNIYNSVLPTITAEVFDELHNNISFQTTNNITGGNSRNYSFTFTTHSTIAGAYTFKLTNEDTNQLQPIVIRDIMVKPITYPTITFVPTQAMVLPTGVNPQMTVEMINPTRYSIHITRAKNPYILLFKQSFSPLWKAQMISGQTIPIHFTAYGAFNGWYIDTKGDYTIILSFDIQKYYTIGFEITGLVLFCYLGIFLFSRKKKDEKN